MDGMDRRTHGRRQNYILRLPRVIKTFGKCIMVTPIVGVCNCSMFCHTLLYVHSSIAIILMGKRELVALLIFLSGVS